MGAISYTELGLDAHFKFFNNRGFVTNNDFLRVRYPSMLYATFPLPVEVSCDGVQITGAHIAFEELTRDGRVSSQHDTDGAKWLGAMYARIAKIGKTQSKSTGGARTRSCSIVDVEKSVIKDSHQVHH